MKRLPGCRARTRAPFLLLVASACTAPGRSSAPTYVDDVAPLLEASCVRCHGGASGVTEARNCVRLDRWGSVPDTTMACSDSRTGGMIFGVHDAGPMLVDLALNRVMPLDAPPLTPAQLAVLAAWRDAGYPRGDGTDSPPPDAALHAPPDAPGMPGVIDAPFDAGPGPGAVSFAGQLQPIFTASCTGAICHSASYAAQGLDLTTGHAYAGLVGVAATEATCAAYQRVRAGQPDQSYLVFKLAGTGACFDGAQMPRNGAALPATQLQLFRDWIANGALNN